MKINPVAITFLAMLCDRKAQAQTETLSTDASLTDLINFFLDHNGLKSDANPFLQELASGALSFDIDGTSVSLENDHLIPDQIFASGAKISVDGVAVPDSDFPQAFYSKDDPRIVVTKSFTGALISASKKTDDGRSVKVVPLDGLAGSENFYATIKPEDVDEDKVQGLHFDMDGLLPTVPGSRKLLRGNDQKDMKSTHTDIGGGSRRRQLQQECDSYKTIELGIYVDSYMCANEGSAQAAIDRAAAIVNQASQEYEVFCKKLVVKEIKAFCSTAKDVMRTHVAAQKDSICDDSVVLEALKKLVADGSEQAPSGDLVHLFSGRPYDNNSRCIGLAYKKAICYGDGWNTGINEMSGWTTNDLLLAHEAGHNMGADHVSSGIMQPSSCGSSCGFSSESISQINKVVDSASCVATESASTSDDEPQSTPMPSPKPSLSPTPEPSPSPTQKPSPSPTQKPSPSPTAKPSPSPTQKPSPSPTPPSATPSPTGSTPSPSVSTPSPTAATPEPTASTPSPSAATPGPTASTPSPSASTPSPTAATSSPAGPVNDQGTCQGPFDQCGGFDYSGSTCCESGYTCVASNEWWSACHPNSLVQLASLQGPQVDPTCKMPWEQCGGDGYDGADCCQAGYTCVVDNHWLSVCKPDNINA